MCTKTMQFSQLNLTTCMGFNKWHLRCCEAVELYTIAQKKNCVRDLFAILQALVGDQLLPLQGWSVFITKIISFSSYQRTELKALAKSAFVHCSSTSKCSPKIKKLRQHCCVRVVKSTTCTEASSIFEKLFICFIEIAIKLSCFILVNRAVKATPSPSNVQTLPNNNNCLLCFSFRNHGNNTADCFLAG